MRSKNFGCPGLTMDSINPLDGGPDATELIAYLQASAEKTRAYFSRELHGELGGLLVAVALDIAFVEQALPHDDQLRQRLARARSTLAAAIELKRKTVEALRPSILDNFGLFEAIKWEVKNESARTRLPCSESYPNVEPKFTPDAAIALFRIAQESLGVALRHPSVKTVHVALDIDTDTVRIGVSHDGEASHQTPATEDLFAICSIAYRAHALGGRMNVTRVPGGGAQYSTTVPLARLTEIPKIIGV
jgi:signal transduction histidine kinase